MSTAVGVSTSTKSGHFRNEDGTLKKKRFAGHSVSLLGIVTAIVWDPFVGILTAVAGQGVAWYDEVISWVKADPFKLAEVRKSMKRAGFKPEQIGYMDKTLAMAFTEYDKLLKAAVENAYVSGNFDRSKPAPAATVEEHKSKLVATMDKDRKAQMGFVESLLREAAELKAAA